MRRLAVVAVVVVSMFSFAPSEAASKVVSKKRLLFKANACGPLCAHNVSDIVGLPFLIAGEGNPAVKSVPTPCGRPAPAGSYADVVVKVPKYVNRLVFTITPKGDWDSFICSKPARGESRLVAQGVNSYPSSFPAPSEQDMKGPFGIRETSIIKVKPGQLYILRAYNWADIEPSPGEVRFLRLT